MANELPLNVAFDKMLKELEIAAKDVSARSGVSDSRISQFRTGRGGDIGVKSLDALLDAARSINPRAREVFATYIGGKSKPVQEMTLAEKGELMMAIGKSIQISKNTDS